MNFVIYPPKSPILVNFFDYPIRYYGFFMMIAFILGIILIYALLLKKTSKKDSELFLDYSPLIIFISIVGARLFYIIGEFEYYKLIPREIFFINHGGLSLFGAIVFGLIGLVILSKIMKFDFVKHCDVIATVFPLCQTIGRFGNFFNQEAYGAPKTSGLMLFVDEKFRLMNYKNVEFYHPTFLYEAILDFMLFVLLLTVFFKNLKLKNGCITCLYLIFYSLIRIFVESIRIDSVLNISGIPIAIIISSVILICSSVFFIYLNKKHA